jgi:Cdc6-like AAA superfamily ATPase
MARAGKRTNPIVLRAGMSIGTNAAEFDDDFLLPCFVQYPPVDLCMNVSSRGMVVDGRTGSGKTAILRYIAAQTAHSVTIDPTEMAMSYVTNSDVLRFLQLIGADLDLTFQVLWKHVLCIEFIRLRYNVESEASSKSVFSTIFEAFSGDDRKKRSINYLRNWEGKRSIVFVNGNNS